MKRLNTGVVIGLLAAIVLIVAVAGVFLVKKSRTTSPPTTKAAAPYNEAKTFADADAKIKAGKCQDVTEDLNDKATSDNQLERALAQLRLGECQILAQDYEKAATTLDASVKVLEELHYFSELDKARMLRDRAHQELQIKQEKNRPLKANPPPTGPVL